MKTLDEVKKEFSYRGEPVAGWARAHGYKPNTARAVLNGKCAGRWGISHEIAIRLGIKDGVIPERDGRKAS